MGPLPKTTESENSQIVTLMDNQLLNTRRVTRNIGQMITIILMDSRNLRGFDTLRWTISPKKKRVS